MEDRAARAGRSRLAVRVSVYWIGKTRLPGVAQLTAEYSGRIARYCDFKPCEVVRRGAAARKASEEEIILGRAQEARLVVLDPAGKRWNSPQFAEFLRAARDRGEREIAFCVGGADGFSEAFRARAALSLSLSPLTMPHELARVVLLEQIYRAFTMLAGHPYPR